MHVLLDQNVPRKLARRLSSHRVETAFSRGWSTLTNGELLSAAELAGFEIVITADQNLEYQQSLSRRRITIIVLDTNRWRWIEPRVPTILEALDTVPVGSFLRIYCFGPLPRR